MFGCSPQFNPGVALADEVQLTFFVREMFRAGSFHRQIDVPAGVIDTPDAAHAAALDRLVLHAVGVEDGIAFLMAMFSLASTSVRSAASESAASRIVVPSSNTVVLLSKTVLSLFGILAPGPGTVLSTLAIACYSHLYVSIRRAAFRAAPNRGNRPKRTQTYAACPR